MYDIGNRFLLDLGIKFLCILINFIYQLQFQRYIMS